MSAATSEPLTKKAYQKLSTLLQKYLSDQDLARIDHAFTVAADAHDGQLRRSGEPYITHPIAVACILADMRLDTDTICAALLHDTIEDTEIELDDLKNDFGPTIANMVYGLTKIERLPAHSKEEVSAASFRKLLFATSHDLRVIVVKLADRIHNMSTISAMKEDSRRRIARETLEVYAPVAEQLGIYRMRDALQSMAFSALDPERKDSLEKSLKKKNKKYGKDLKAMVKHLQKKLAKSNVHARISARVKSTYSVYRKMQSKRQSMHEIMDIFGIRIVVEEPIDCYVSLGIIHAIYPARQGKFKDYISVPKETTGYQSLHTVVTLLSEIPVEIQIRTEEMDHIAENGIAAHTRYKVGKDAGYSHHVQQLFERMQSSSHEEDEVAPLDFLERIKEELMPREIMVFTPKGKLIHMPEGSTVLDFAYHIHTGVGNRCVTAYVDGRSVSRGEIVESGHTVRVVTSKTIHPTPRWLEQVVSARAKTAIRQALKKMEFEESMSIGMRMLDAACTDLNKSLESLPEDKIQERIAEIGYERLEDLAADIAIGNRLPHPVAEHMLGCKIAHHARGNVLSLDGSETAVVTYANCCHPIPGDSIVGHLTKGKGTVIHRMECPNLEELQKAPERMIKCRWESHIRTGFTAPIQVDVEDAPGVLAALTSITAHYGINIEGFEYLNRDVISTIRFEFKVRSSEDLDEVMNEIYQLKTVKTIKRV